MMAGMQNIFQTGVEIGRQQALEQKPVDLIEFIEIDEDNGEKK